MSEQRRLSPAGLALIKRFEGFRARPARLPDGRFLYGYGHAAAEAPGAPIDETAAERLLLEDVAAAEGLVNERIFAPLTQAQFDALVSLAFSIGAGAFLSSAVAERVNRGAPIAAADAFDAWRNSTVLGAPRTLDALVRRRAAEKAHFLSDPPATPAPSVFVAPLADAAYLATPAVQAKDAPVLDDAPALEQSVPSAAPRDIDLAGLNDSFAAAVEAQPPGPSGRIAPPAWTATGDDEPTRLKRIIAADPRTAPALSPPPSFPREPAEVRTPEPGAPAPASSARVSDMIGLGALGVFGAALLAAAAGVWGEGDLESRMTAMLLAGPGSIAVAMALYYLLIADRRPGAR
jgi:lysozyme